MPGDEEELHPADEEMERLPGSLRGHSMHRHDTT